MRTSSKILLVAVIVTALVPLWGYWYSIRHASLQLNVDDYALKTPTQLFGAPHGVSLVLRDASDAQLAVGRSVEPLGYILAVDPDPAIGDCEHRDSSGAVSPEAQNEYAACYARYSAWSATWADRVHRADVSVGSCEIRSVPVTVERSNSEWPTWWVPLRHIGGLPREYFNFGIAIDSRACVAATQSR